jgi:hypothetical protein
VGVEDMDLSLLPDMGKNSKELDKARQESLERLISGKTPPDKVYEKPGRGKTKQRYVSGFWFVSEMNSIFNHLWSQEVREFKMDFERNQVVALIRVSVKKPGMTVVETFPDGRRVETRYDEMEVIKDQFGSSELKKYSEGKNLGKYMDLGDDCKSAATDGFKKCCSLLGICRDVYEPREVVDELEGLDEVDVKIRPVTLRLEKYDVKWSKDETVKWIEKTLGKSLNEVYEADVTTTLPKLMKEIKK